jgi:hypothetical protein
MRIWSDSTMRLKKREPICRQMNISKSNKPQERCCGVCSMTFTLTLGIMGESNCCGSPEWIEGTGICSFCGEHAEFETE